MAGPIRIAILANGRQARSEIDRTSGSLGRLGRLAKGGLAVAGIGGLAYGVAALGKASISAEAKFSTSMRLIQAATKAPESAMGRLNDLAIKLGNDTQFSASEAADAMLELAKAGLSTNTIMRGGLAGTLQLAAAGGTDLATASTIAANALNTFNLGGRDMASVAAALAGGANASSASVESLGLALQQVGPGATNAGLSLQETVAALSAFDAAGIKGSDAGTSLKTMLTRLVPTTAKAADEMDRLGLKFTDANGEFLSLTQISQELQREFRGLSAAERTKALSTVFGSDATRAATVLMKEGAAGVRDYIKATNDQTAAQKMAEARMGGTAGALERLSGAAETAMLRIGQELAPATVVVAGALADKMGPALEGTIGLIKNTATALAPVGSALADLGHLAADAAGFIGGLPGPVKELAIQAGLAALVLPRLAAGAATIGGAFTTAIARTQQFRAELTYATTRAQIASSVMSRLGGAARTAAGVGGMVALAQGAKTTNTALNTLANVGGGALLGFSVGGPIGAALGAGVGGLKSLWDWTQKSAHAMEAAKAKAAEYAASIDRIAAASGRAQRAEALSFLQREGDIIPAANAMGIATGDLISALLGEQKAISRVNAVWKANGDLNVGQGVELQKLTGFLREQGFVLRLRQDELKKQEVAIKGVREETGRTAAASRDVNKVLRNIGSERPSTGKWTRIYAGDLDGATRTTRTKAAEMADGLREGTARARADLGPFGSSLRGQLGGLEGTARSGGVSIGNALGQGVASGIGNYVGAAAAAAVNLVANAVAAAKREGKIQSPSLRMREVGDYMGQGLVVGLDGQRKAVGAAGKALAREAARAAQIEAGRPNWTDMQMRSRNGRMEVTVTAPPVQVILDGREIRHEIRHEANRVVNAQLDYERVMGG